MSKEAKQMSKLFLVNIPYNCSDRELQEWVESRGLRRGPSGLSAI